MSDVERIKDAIRIEQYIGQYVDLKGSRHLKACCPFHSEHTPSFIVDTEFQSWKCWGACGEGGDVIAFAMKLHNLTFGEALEELARYAGIVLTPLSPEKHAQDMRRERIAACLEASAQYYHEALYRPFGIFALAYLKEKRGLSDETIKAARLGYSPNGVPPGGFTDDELTDAGIMRREKESGIPYSVFRERIMIPITDMRGRVIGFSGRATMDNQQIKYLYNAGFEKSKTIHVLPSKTRATRFPEVITVEGSLDPISALNRGVYNVVSQLGSALSEEQFLTLSKMSNRLIFCYDNDPAGKAATLKLSEHLQSAARLGVELFVMSAPHGKDPDDTFREKPELWQPAVDQSRPLTDVLIEMSIGVLPQNATMTDKSKEIVRLLKVFSVDNPLITRENREKLAAAYGVREDDLDMLARRMFDIRVVVRNDKPKPTTSHLPTIEEWVLHGLIVNDDDKWLERANARLLIASDESLPYALAPLNLNDFTGHKTRAFIAKILEYVKEGFRPVFDPLEAYVKDTPMQETYERLQSLDIRARECGYPCEVSYDTFIDNVYQLRINRLKEELPGMQSEALRHECLKAIACLTLGQEELI